MTGRKDSENWGSKESEREGKRQPEDRDPQGAETQRKSEA